MNRKKTKKKNKKFDLIKGELRIDFFSLFFVLEHIFFTGKAKVLTLTHATHTLMRYLCSHSLLQSFHLLAGEFLELICRRALNSFCFYLVCLYRDSRAQIMTQVLHSHQQYMETEIIQSLSGKQFPWVILSHSVIQIFKKWFCGLIELTSVFLRAEIFRIHTKFEENCTHSLV